MVIKNTSKPSLYVLLTNCKTLECHRGDKINEFRALETLSSVFEVFYNNDLYDSSKSNIGKSDYLGPKKKYDYYYIRNNPEIYNSIIGKKFILGTPNEINKCPNPYGIFVTTSNWKDHLMNKFKDSKEKLKLVYGNFIPKVTSPIFLLEQRIDERISNNRKNEIKAFSYKVKTTGNKNIFGFYGNLGSSMYPRLAIAALEKFNLETSGPKPLLILAGKIRDKLEGNNYIYLSEIPYSEMHYLYECTKVGLVAENPSLHLAGHNKVLDYMSKSIPFICKKMDTFIYQLTEIYPCFYETEDDALNLIRKLVYDKDFYKEVKLFLKKRSHYFTLKEVQDRFKLQNII